MAKSKENKKNTFAINMVARRVSLGFKSAESFSEFAEIPHPTVRDIEAGISAGSAATKAKIAKALKTTVDELNTPAHLSESKVPQMTVAEFKDAIKEAVEKPAERIERLMAHANHLENLNENLKEILDKIPNEILNHYPAAHPAIQATVLYILTGRREHFEGAMPPELADKIEKLFGHVGYAQTPKGRVAR